MAVGGFATIERHLTAGTIHSDGPGSRAGWVRFVSLPTSGVMYFLTGQNSSDIYLGWTLGINASGNLVLQHRNSGSTVTGSATLSSGTWYHIRMTEVQGSISHQRVRRVFIGDSTTPDIDSTQGFESYGNIFHLGWNGQPPSPSFAAVEVWGWKAWSAEVSHADVSWLTCEAGRTSDLVGEWHLETATDLDDYSGAGNHLTLSSGSGSLSTVSDPSGVSCGGGGPPPEGVAAQAYFYQQLLRV